MSDWVRAHGAEGILSEADVAELRAADLRVLALLWDKQWHSASEIRLAAGRNGAEASEGLRRLRDVRAALRGIATVTKRREEGTRNFQYRLTVDEPVQQDMF